MDNNLILNNIKSIVGCDTDNKLANILGIRPTVLSNWRVRNSINYELIITKCGIDVLSRAIKDNSQDTISKEHLSHYTVPSQMELIGVNMKLQEEISQLKSKIIEMQDDFIKKEEQIVAKNA
jgi:hypothetical protein